MKFALAALTVAVFAAGIHWVTFAAGGSDSYCYVHQAEGWATGRLQVVEPLALEAPWPAAPLTFAPAGHIPSPTVPGAHVPICPAGLSMVMAPFIWAGWAGRAGRAGGEGGVGGAGWVVVVPLFGALLIWATYLLGSRFSPGVGLGSAAVVACSAAFLFQLMQPMSDVPAAALWVLAAACATSQSRRAPLMAGLATSAAILVRPNLLPMGFVLGAHFLRTSGSDPGDGATQPLESGHEWGLTPAAIFAAACAPGCIAVALIQQMFYGSPLRSGYGSLDGLFAVEHIGPNALRYFRWMVESHTPIWLLAVAAPFARPRRVSGLLLLLAIVNVLCYLPYVVFNDWWYLRFVLPAIAILIVLTVALVDALMVQTWRTSPWVPNSIRGEPLPHHAVLAAATLLFCVLFVREARARNVFDLHRLEARYERAGSYVASHLPPNALVITSWESGSVRYYGHRTTLVWDALDPAWLDRAIAYARTRGLEPYLLFETWEEPIFRQRFAGSAIAKLDWPPAAEIASQVRIYRPDDRDRYLRGDATPTEYAR
jgi:hypothetical protein